MDNLDILRAHQKESAQEFEERLKASKQAQMDYLESEDYERDCWEKNEDMWEQKARKEGWHYTRKPFVSALDRQEAADQRKAQKIAELEEKLRILKGE
ncbi:MAG: hypothetical protein IJ069_09095 [Prevotella sp.]|nr:hypothetical protein [Prevotella sp.]